jgi:hypothetical protein
MSLDRHKPKNYRRAWSGGRDLTKELSVSVTARCIGCGMKREIRPNEIAPGDHPCCTSCGMPMIAELATAHTPPDAKEPR